MIPGWIVARGIPPETWVGLITGQYQLYGGVIRWAGGTAKAGQIVQHLIPVHTLNMIPGLNFIPGIAANLQLNELKSLTNINTQQLIAISTNISSLSQSTQQVIQLVSGTAVLSGLGLAVSAIGFIAINDKLNKIDSKLNEVQKDITNIKSFLESTERARLAAALSDLLKIDSRTAPEHRHTILHNSRAAFSQINMRYRELLSQSSTIETAIAHEEYFSLTGLAQVRCTAELGMFDIAHKEMAEINSFWHEQAYRIANEIILGKYPQRFLATDFVNDVSVVEIAQWLDFSSPEKKGLAWIDELRKKIKERWYRDSWFADEGLNKNVGLGLKKERSMLIPAFRKLIARSSIFESYVTQYEILDAQSKTPSEFNAQLASLPEDSFTDGYLILEPTPLHETPITLSQKEFSPLSSST
jgi:hypothetical protein